MIKITQKIDFKFFFGSQFLWPNFNKKQIGQIFKFDHYGTKNFHKKTKNYSQTRL